MTATSRIAGVPGDAGLDLAELDAEAADLDLVVDAAEVLDVAVREAARQIAGAVEPWPAEWCERVRDEALGGQLGAVEIAARHAGAADVDLAGHADRARARRADRGGRPAGRGSARR